MKRSKSAVKAMAAAITVLSCSAQASTEFGAAVALRDPDAGAQLASATLGTPSAPRSGDQIHGIEYDFSSGGVYVSTGLNLAAASQVAGTHLRLRVRAPATTALGLRILDGSGQTLQYALNRNNAARDDLGWETHIVPVASRIVYFGGNANGVLNGTIRQVSLLVSNPASPLAKKGTAYLRGFEILQSAPSATDPVLPQKVVDFTGPAIVRLDDNGQGRNTYRTGGINKSGDGIQSVQYNFQPGGQAAGLLMDLPTPLHGTHVRFRARTSLPATQLQLRVVKADGGIVNLTPDLSSAQADGSDWSTYTVWLGTNPLLISKVAVLVKRPASSSAYAGTLYVKDLDVLDRAPSADQPLVAASLVPISTYGIESGAIAAANAPSLSSSTVAGETVHSISYNFGTTNWANAYVALVASLPSTSTPDLNRLRFSARVNHGIPMAVQFVDSDNKVFNVKVFKPLSTVGTNGFAQYSVNLESNDGRTVAHPIKQVKIRLERAINNTNTLPFSILAVTPTGTADFKNVTVSSESGSLDLSSKAQASRGLRPKGTDPAQNTGIAVQAPRDDAQAVADIGFKYVRMDMTWSVIQPTMNGPFLLGANDPKFKDVDAIVSRGMKPVLILGYGNDAYPGSANDEKRGITPQDPNYFAAFIDYVTTVTNKFHSSNPQYADMVFEIWNEPNLINYWKPAVVAADYAQMLKEAVRVIHQLDPNRKVVSGGLANIHQVYLNQLIQNGNGALADVNGVGLHPYADQHPESQADEGLAAMDLLRTNGLVKPVWMTESGTSSVKASRTAASGQTQSALDPGARELQAAYLARQVLTSWAANHPLHVVFRYRDNVSLSSWQPNYFEHNWGLIGWSSKEPGATLVNLPAQVAMKTLLGVTSGRTYQGLLTGDPTNLQAMKFAGTGRETVYVVWVNSIGGSASFSVPAGTCSTSVNLKGEASYTPSCVLTMLGETKTCTPAANNRQLCTIREEDGPVYVRMPAN